MYVLDYYQLTKIIVRTSYFLIITHFNFFFLVRFFIWRFEQIKNFIQFLVRHLFFRNLNNVSKQLNLILFNKTFAGALSRYVHL